MKRITEFGVAIKVYRERNLMTQEQLADILGVTKNTVYSWEKKGSRPSMDFMIMLADMMEIRLLDAMVMANAGKSKKGVY